MKDFNKYRTSEKFKISAAVSSGRAMPYIFLLFALAVTMATSCKDDTEMLLKQSDTYKFSYITPHTTLPVTKGMSVNQEKAIQDIYILVFMVNGGGTPAENRFVYAVQASNINSTAGTFGAPLQSSGSDLHKMVLIANAGNTVLSIAGTFTSATTEDEANRALTYSMGSKHDVSTPIPMWSEGRPSVISPGMDISSIYQTGLSSLVFLRSMAKVNIRNQTGSNFRLTYAAIYNSQDHVSLVPQPQNIGSSGSATAPTIPSAAVLNGVLWEYYNIPEKPIDELINEIYIPESEKIASPPTSDPNLLLDKVTCLVVGGYYGGSSVLSYYRIDFTDAAKSRIDLLRNFSYNITIQKITGDGYSSPTEAVLHRPINASTQLTAFDDRLRITTDGTYQLCVSANDTVYLGYNTSGREFTVITDFPEGWTAVAASGGSWLSVTATGNTSSGSIGQLNITPAVNDAPNADSRTASILVSAGRVQKTIIIQQEISPTRYTDEYPSNRCYVGAFWKSYQRGERLIRIPIPNAADRGKWSARVIWKDNSWDHSVNDIYLSATTSLDPMVYTSGTADMLIKDYLYPVSDLTPYTGGNTGDIYQDEIFFRIGLKDYFTPTPQTPARYAVVLVTYGNPEKHFRIFLRQGHWEDYLMRPDDMLDAVGQSANARPYARKFSVYNLTDPGNNTASLLTLTPEMEENGAAFTDFPSQAGYHFFFCYSRQATNPYTRDWGSADDWRNTVTTYSKYATDYSQNFMIAGLGTVFTSNTRPPGMGKFYRQRVSDGAVVDQDDNEVSSFTDANHQSTDTDNSELKQSLFLKLSQATTGITDNAVFGCYADGFFDRRLIGDQPSYGYGVDAGTQAGYSNAVAENTPQVAFEGALFFNPNSYASLFIPLAGYRGQSVADGDTDIDPSTGSNRDPLQFNGSLRHAGSRGVYWSASSQSNQAAWTLVLENVNGVTVQSKIDYTMVNRTAACSFRTVVKN